MLTCKECGRKFKSKEALGGHMSFHRKNIADAAPNPELPQSSQLPATKVEPEGTGPPPVQQPQSKAPEDEAGKMASIRNLKRQGYSARQIKEVFGYNRTTVDLVFEKDIPSEGKPQEEDEGEHEGNNTLPVTVKGTEAVTPEYIIRSLVDGSPEWRLRFEGMMLLRAAQRMNRDDVDMNRVQVEAYAAMIKPTLELMRESRLEQDAAAARARDSSFEIAQRAALEAAQGMKGAFSLEMQALKSALPGSPEPANPMMAAFLSAAMPMLGQIFQRVTGAGQQPGAFTQPPPVNAGTPGEQAPAPGIKPGEENEFSEV